MALRNRQIAMLSIRPTSPVLLALGMLLTSVPARSQLVPGSMDVH